MIWAGSPRVASLTIHRPGVLFLVLMAFGSPSRKRGLIIFRDRGIYPEGFVADEKQGIWWKPGNFLVEPATINIAQMGNNSKCLLAGPSGSTYRATCVADAARSL